MNKEKCLSGNCDQSVGFTCVACVLEKENRALKAALKDVMAAVLELSNSLGPTLDAINNHAKVILPLVQEQKSEG